MGGLFSSFKPRKSLEASHDTHSESCSEEFDQQPFDLSQETQVELERLSRPQRDYSTISADSCKVLIEAACGLEGPYCLTVNNQREIIICEMMAHTVSVYESINEVKLNRRIGNGRGSARGQLDRPAGVCLNSFGEIFVTEMSNHRVSVFRHDGSFSRTFGSKGNANGQLNNPWGICCDRQHNIYVADNLNHRIVVFDRAGNFQRTFGSTGDKDGELTSPIGVGVLSNGHVIVGDCNARIQLFDETGKFVRVIGSEGSDDAQFGTNSYGSSQLHVLVDDFDRVIVSDCYNNRVHFYDEQLRLIGAFGDRQLGAAGRFSKPEGLALDVDGSVLVIDSSNNQVWRFSFD
jgi:DNA-binding beta-propeller fold protein YncE